MGFWAASVSNLLCVIGQRVVVISYGLLGSEIW
jgi:hypothetical protein